MVRAKGATWKPHMRDAAKSCKLIKQNWACRSPPLRRTFSWLPGRLALAVAHSVWMLGTMGQENSSEESFSDVSHGFCSVVLTQ